MVIVLIIIAIIYCALPWYIEIAAWIVNLFCPDTIPLIDELLMFVPIVSKIKKIAIIADILERYWKLLIVVLLLIVGLIIYLLLK